MDEFKTFGNLPSDSLERDAMSYLFSEEVLSKSAYPKKVSIYDRKTRKETYVKPGEVYSLLQKEPQTTTVISTPHISWLYCEEYRRFSINTGENILMPFQSFSGILLEKFEIPILLLQNRKYGPRLNKGKEFPYRTNLFLHPNSIEDGDGVLAGVSAEMGIHDNFWDRYAECSKADFLELDFIEYEERPNHTYIKSWPTEFMSTDGEEGRRQRALLDRLFGINEANPHFKHFKPPAKKKPKRWLFPVSLKGVDLPASEPTALELLIAKFRAGQPVEYQEMIEQILESDGCILVQHPADVTGTAAVLGNPEGGRPMLAVFTSVERAHQGWKEKPGKYEFIVEKPIRLYIEACKDTTGIVINPFSDDLMFDLNAEQVKQVKSEYNL